MRASGLPVLVDGDTGYGEALNVARLVRELEDAGAAAVQIEDQVLPKKCGHLSDKRLASPEEMARKVAAAVRAARHLRIVARTDALELEGLDRAIARARLYQEAGAHVIFPEALRTAEELRVFVRGRPGPAPREHDGVRADAAPARRRARAARLQDGHLAGLGAPGVRARDDGLLRRSGPAGTQAEWLDRMQTRRELYELIGYHDYEALDDSPSPGASLPDERHDGRHPEHGGP